MMTSMRRTGLLWALCVLSGPWQPTALAQSTDPEPAGFTQTQAAAGKIAYDRHCASCHGAGLEGAGITPGLAGDRFDVHWRGVPADRLMSQLRRMPPESPGGLSAETYAGVLAYILQFNGIAAGDEPVPAGAAALAGLTIPSASGTQSASIGPAGDTSSAPTSSARLRRLGAVTHAMLRDPPDEDWLSWRRTYDSQGFSALAQIDRRNVDGLELVWRVPLAPGENNPMPLVHDGVMFLFTYPDTVLALDASNGSLLWRHQHAPQVRSSKKMGIALHGHKVLVPTSDLHVLALDARTGERIWDHGIEIETAAWAGGNSERSREPGQNHGGYQLRSAPWVAGGLVIQGVTAINVPGGGFVVALDVETGTEAWRFHTVARPGEPGGHSWNDLPLAQRSGGSVWNQGSYDPDLNLVYFGTGPTYDTGPLLHPVDTAGVSNDALFTNTTLALDRQTGALVWYYQHLANDQWDLDWAFERQLMDLPIDGATRRVVLTAGKLAILDALDAATGDYLFSIDMGLQNVVETIDPRTGVKSISPDAVPSLTEPHLICPNHYGIRSWPGLAFNPLTNILYLPLTAGCMVAGPDGYGLLSSGVRLAASLHPESSDGTMGRLQAVNLETRTTVWQRREVAPLISAALATAGGVVFAGDLNRSFKAYDDASGEVLWETVLDDVPSSSVVTYAVGGRQHVAVVVGQTNNHVNDWSRVFSGLGADAGMQVNDDPGGGPAILVFALADSS